MKIEFRQPKPRIEDWRVIVDGRTVGSVWRCGNEYRASVTRLDASATLDGALKAARKQIRAAGIAR